MNGYIELSRAAARIAAVAFFVGLIIVYYIKSFNWPNKKTLAKSLARRGCPKEKNPQKIIEQ